MAEGKPFALGPAAGSRILVSGGCGGIGRALVDALLATACRVAVLDMATSISAYPPPAGTLALTADATQPEELAAAAATIRQEWGAVDGFVNLCGFSVGRTPIADYDYADWQRVVEGNLHSAFLLSREFLPLLRQGNNPAMVQVASSLAVSSAPGYGPYSVSKAGMLALTRMLVAENSPEIRINAVAPSAVRTQFMSGGTGRPERAGGSLVDLEAYGAALPAGRVAEPEDVVGPILFLLGPGSRYMTGQVLHVNGGLWQP